MSIGGNDPFRNLSGSNPITNQTNTKKKDDSGTPVNEVAIVPQIIINKPIAPPTRPPIFPLYLPSIFSTSDTSPNGCMDIYITKPFKLTDCFMDIDISPKQWTGCKKDFAYVFSGTLHELYTERNIKLSFLLRNEDSIPDSYFRLPTTIKGFPKTSFWVMGHANDDKGTIIKSMKEMGDFHGIKLISELNTSHCLEPWMQDCMEFTPFSIRIPYVLKLSEMDDLETLPDQLSEILTNLTNVVQIFLGNGPQKTEILNKLHGLSVNLDKLTVCGVSKVLEDISDIQDIIDPIIPKNIKDLLDQYSSYSELLQKANSDYNQCINYLNSVTDIPGLADYFTGQNTPAAIDFFNSTQGKQIISYFQQVNNNKTQAENQYNLFLETNAISEERFNTYKIFLDCQESVLGLTDLFSETIKMSISDIVGTCRKAREEDLYITGKEFSKIGQTFSKYNYLDAILLAKGMGIKLEMSLTYSEGGNTLSGLHDDVPYFIIGQDTVDVSWDFLKKQLGGVDDRDKEGILKKAFGLDYGAFPGDIYFVEQPGDFHLDMRMAVVGPKTVVLNKATDSLKTYVQLRWGSEDEIPDKYKEKYNQLMEHAEMLEAFEDKAEEQLKEQGFTVIRIPGAFPNFDKDDKTKECMNFFNMVQATTPDGKPLIVALGCVNEEFEKLFMKMVVDPICKKQEIDIEDITVRFLPYEASVEYLDNYGGISCAVKSVPFVPKEESKE